jgi:hypothetical protein
MRARKQQSSASRGVKQKIFPVHSLIHTLSTRCPQLIHKAALADASRDHFSISDAANSRSMPLRFNLSNKNDCSVPMMRAGR